MCVLPFIRKHYILIIYKIKVVHNKGKPIISLFASLGTTDAFMQEHGYLSILLRLLSFLDFTTYVLNFL